MGSSIHLPASSIIINYMFHDLVVCCVIRYFLHTYMYMYMYISVYIDSILNCQIYGVIAKWFWDSHQYFRPHSSMLLSWLGAWMLLCTLPRVDMTCHVAYHEIRYLYLLWEILNSLLLHVERLAFQLKILPQWGLLMKISKCYNYYLDAGHRQDVTILRINDIHLTPNLR